MNLGKEISLAGKELATVNVKVGPRFLNLFSQQLYSSPNKAFEELLSNSWDAGADTVYVRIPDNLSLEDSTVWVLDNGSSMDSTGLQALWNVAHSPKVDRLECNGRKPIGKFGIGKLATYILCNELTYVCKYNDGVIRAVTMDYRRIDATAQENDEISPDGLGLPLSVRELSAKELTDLISKHDSNDELIKLINSNVPKAENVDFGDYEFGEETKPSENSPDTWTLVLLTSLKTSGTKLQSGRIKRILRIALPLGNSMTIIYNGEALNSTKSEVKYTEWKFDEKFPIPEFTAELSEGVTSTYKVIGFDEPYPHIKISGLPGELLGSTKIFEKSIAGDNLKSEDMGHSNGFVINVLGRVINIDGPYFGLKNLQHTTWSQFRCAVRADWLDKFISVSREDVQEGDELLIFRAFLMACFNRVTMK